MFVGGTDWFLSSILDRRALLKGASSAAFGLLASACGSSSPTTSPSAGSSSGRGGRASETSTAPVRSAAGGRAAEKPETIYVFQAGPKDVTLVHAPHPPRPENPPLG